MTTDTAAASISRLSAAAATMTGLQAAIDAGAPWPVRAVMGDGPEAEWGPPEVLAHVTEMLPYWLGEIERVLAGSTEPVPFGRVSSDPVRGLIIERDRSLPSRELLGRIHSGVERYALRLPQLSNLDWARRGIHPRLGEMTVEAMLERFVVGHAQEHAEQLKATLGV
ncbi:MAG: DinB family protein [Candidatus Limnocylindrales bacterium]